MDFLLFDSQCIDQVKENVLPLLKVDEVFPCEYKAESLPDWPAGSRVLLYLSDEQICSMLALAVERKWHLALLPHPNAAHSMKGWGCSVKLDEAEEDALTQDVSKVDLLLCNQRPILNALIIGQVYSLRPGGAVEGIAKKWQHIFRSLISLRAIIPKRYVVQTKNADAIETASIGMTVVEHGRNSSLGRKLLPDSQINDGMFHIIMLAPRSVVEFFRLISHSVFARNVNSVPRSIALFKTMQAVISSEPGIEYRQDGVEMCASRLELECQPQVLGLIPGRHVEIDLKTTEQKEQRKIQHLPMGETVSELCKRPLRWITHASGDDFRELYQTLRENATPSAVFLTLMILSTLLASFGLFANSPPVIIGAMILAPLMGPIISLAMAMVRQDLNLLRSSVITLLIGLGLGLLFAIIVSWLIPLVPNTSEILARVRPTLIDLGVAVVSGIAGAYAHAKASLAKSMAGVAIAVALVPPLAVTGIGISWWDLPMMSGAFLLFFTNLCGIVLSAAITFILLGYAPFQRAKRGLIISTLAVALVSVPLAFSFSNMLNESITVQKLEGLQIDNIRLESIQISAAQPLTISLNLLSKQPLLAEDHQRVKQHIEGLLGQKVVLKARSLLLIE
ncbi:TIGR00341 family protein [Alginatibacterium sediminis]|uniref:TIGR00341 family protein n=1 Tax=Alginatibacterium sediminis TaxID=2164068 RepID=A0A420E9P7_9ALTE|nr:TIGR00341 family protein [Alginatibacterium sediminis]RKF17399.1 TIGR00341 family protein [Alginatibacterium sediminis]